MRFSSLASFRRRTTMPPREPSAVEVAAALACALAVHYLVLLSTHGLSYWVLARGDNIDYVHIAAIIRQRSWDCVPLCPEHAWGLPAAAALVGEIFPIGNEAALVAVTLAASFVVGLLVRRLYGGWVALGLVAVGPAFIRLTAVGASEPLFMCLLYGAFARARTARFRSAMVLACLATMVRPIGAIAVPLLMYEAWRRGSKRDVPVLCAIVPGLALAYWIPIAALTPDLAVTWQAYGEDFFPTAFPFGVPLVSLAVNWLSLFESRVPEFIVLPPVWVAAWVVSLWLVWSRPYPADRRLERLFLTVYVSFFLCSVYGNIAAFFPRYALPVAPLVIGALNLGPLRDRRLLWPLVFISGLIDSGMRDLIRSIAG